MEWITTSTILDRLRDYNNQAAWDQFASRFRRPLISFARRFGLTTEEADDISQEILIAFAEGYRNNRYDPSMGRLSSWLFGIAYRQIAAMRRKHMAEQKHINRNRQRTSFWAELPDEASASAIWDREWEQTVIDTCMSQAKREFKEKTYQAFDIIVRQERSADEAAAELGMSRDAVYVAKHRVLKRIAELAREIEEGTPDS